MLWIYRGLIRVLRGAVEALFERREGYAMQRGADALRTDLSVLLKHKLFLLLQGCGKVQRHRGRDSGACCHRQCAVF